MQTTEKPKTIYLKDYQPTDYNIESVDLMVDLFESHTVVKSSLVMSRRESTAAGAPLVLHGENLELQQISLEGQPLPGDQYEANSAGLIIHHVPDHFVLETIVHIKPQDNKTLMGLYKSRNNFCTQCEAEGFRRITYFYDRPDMMTYFTTTVSADKSMYPYLLSNGNLVEQGEADEGRHWAKWHDPSLKPSYLFALVAGDFDLIEDTFTTLSGRDVALQFFLEKGFKDQGYYAMESLKRAMQWDEQTYGREYDLDIYMVVAVSDFNMGAMENKGLNVFNTKYVLAKPETATDCDYVAIEDVIGHEYFHNWTGNRITCRDWFQLTLKEGLTVFRDQTFSEDMTSQAVARINEVNVVRNGQFPEDAGPLAHPIRPQSYIEINNFYTATVYRKGAEVIRMIHTLITPEGFRKGMDLYFERHDGQAVTTEDFVAAMQDASGKDLTQFKRWYDQAGTPRLTITDHYDDSKQCYEITVQQSCPGTPGQEEKLPFHMPLAVGLFNADGEPMSAKLEGESAATSGTKVLELTEASHTFRFVDVPSKPLLSLNRGFSAPVNIEYHYTLEELALLVQHDTDAIARWDASQQLALKVIVSAAKQFVDGAQPQVDAAITTAFSALLADDVTEKNLLAQLVALPSLAYLIQNAPHMDIMALHHAREFYKKELALRFEPNWQEHYERFHSTQAYEYNVHDMGLRAWKNSCLHYLVASGNNTYATLAYEQMQQADNMTDSAGALLALNSQDGDTRDQALEAFYQQWHAEPLVINKWLSIQAMATLADTLEKVKVLTQHPAYDAKNPNNVYSLIGGFGANQAALHEDEQGAGYQFIAEQVIAIDAYNPQVAGRVLTPLTRWRQFDESRGQLMLQQLKVIAAQPELSSDVFELVQKSIQ